MNVFGHFGNINCSASLCWEQDRESDKRGLCALSVQASLEEGCEIIGGMCVGGGKNLIHGAQ